MKPQRVDSDPNQSLAPAGGMCCRLGWCGCCLQQSFHCLDPPCHLLHPCLPQLLILLMLSFCKDLVSTVIFQNISDIEVRPLVLDLLLSGSPRAQECRLIVIVFQSDDNELKVSRYCPLEECCLSILEEDLVLVSRWLSLSSLFSSRSCSFLLFVERYPPVFFSSSVVARVSCDLS